MRLLILCVLAFVASCGGQEILDSASTHVGSKNVWKVYHDPVKFRQANARATLQGKISVVMIGSTTCGPCKSVQEWWNQYPVKGVRFVELEIDDNVEGSYKKALTTTYKYIPKQQREGAEIDVVLPLCSIERNGDVLYQDGGKRDRGGCLEAMQQALEQIRSEPKPPLIAMKSVEWKTVTTSVAFWKAVEASKRAIVVFSSPTCGPCHHAIDWWKKQQAPADVMFIEYALESDDHESTPALKFAWEDIGKTADHFFTDENREKGQAEAFPICGLVHPIEDGGHVHDANQVSSTGCTIELAKEIGIRK